MRQALTLVSGHPALFCRWCGCKKFVDPRAQTTYDEATGRPIPPAGHWSMEDIVAQIDARAPKPSPRGPYKKRVPAA